jgi:hypothetical protein
MPRKAGLFEASDGSIVEAFYYAKKVRIFHQLDSQSYGTRTIPSEQPMCRWFSKLGRRLMELPTRLLW